MQFNFQRFAEETNDLRLVGRFNTGLVRRTLNRLKTSRPGKLQFSRRLLGRHAQALHFPNCRIKYFNRLIQARIQLRRLGAGMIEKAMGLGAPAPGIVQHHGNGIAADGFDDGILGAGQSLIGGHGGTYFHGS